MADDVKTQEWKSGLPEEIKTAPALRDVPDVATLAKRFIDTQAYVGSSIRVPGPDANEQQRVDFVSRLREKVPEVLFLPEGDGEDAKLARETAWTKLGRPKEAKDYALPNDVQLEEAHLEALRKEATEEGLTNSQFQARAKRVWEALEQDKTARRGTTDALKKELGAAFDERTAAAASVAAKLGFSQELVAALKNGTVDVPTFKAFSQIAKGFGESRQVADQGNAGGGGRLTPAEAMAQRAEIMARSEYFNPKSHQMAIHESLKRKVQELNDLISQ